jgi:hypothetical protein
MRAPTDVTKYILLEVTAPITTLLDVQTTTPYVAGAVMTLGDPVVRQFWLPDEVGETAKAAFDEWSGRER